MSRAFAILAVLTVVACGAKSSQEGTTKPTVNPTEPIAETPEQPAAEIAWADKNEDQKKKHMKEVVMPRMKALFAGAPEPPEEFNCAFCHGEGVREGKFEMPNQALQPLDPKDDFAAHRKDHASTVEFMMKVESEMANALGVEPYDMVTHKGFGCFNCHTMKK